MINHGSLYPYNCNWFQLKLKTKCIHALNPYYYKIVESLLNNVFHSVNNWTFNNITNKFKHFLNCHLNVQDIQLTTFKSMNSITSYNFSGRIVQNDGFYIPIQDLDPYTFSCNSYFKIVKLIQSGELTGMKAVVGNIPCPLLKNNEEKSSDNVYIKLILSSC